MADGGSEVCGSEAPTGTGLQCVSPAVVAELFTDVQDTSAMAYSVDDSDGVCFVPSFSGLQVPHLRLM